MDTYDFDEDHQRHQNNRMLCVSNCTTATHSKDQTINSQHISPCALCIYRFPLLAFSFNKFILSLARGIMLNAQSVLGLPGVVALFEIRRIECVDKCASTNTRIDYEMNSRATLSILGKRIRGCFRKTVAM